MKILKNPTFYYLALPMILPHGLSFNQEAHNTLAPKYIFITTFLFLLFTTFNKIKEFKTNDYIQLISLIIISICSYFYTGFFELTFISILMVTYSLIVLRKTEINKETSFKILDFIFPIIILKGIFYSWYQSRNFGLGNPNHAGFSLCLYYSIMLFRRKYLHALILIFCCFLTLSYGTILSALIVTASYFLNFYNLFHKQKKVVQILVVILTPILMTFGYKYLITFSMEKSKLIQGQKLALKLEDREVEHNTIKRGKFDIYHPSKLTRIYQLDKFIENIDKNIIFGNEVSFITKYKFTIHNALFGNIVIIGGLATLFYTLILMNSFSNQLFILASLSPFFAFDTPTKLNSYFIIQSWIIGLLITKYTTHSFSKEYFKKFIVNNFSRKSFNRKFPTTFTHFINFFRRKT